MSAHPPLDGSRDSRGELPTDPDTSPPHLRPTVWLVVVIGATIGAAGRIYLGHRWPAPPGGWPWATFGINLVGSFALGAVLEALARLGTDSGWRQTVRMLVATGVCSTFTTYSAMALEINALAGDGHPITATAYGLISVVAGIAAAFLGIQVTGLSWHAARG